jgi:hypothetical protein
LAQRLNVISYYAIDYEMATISPMNTSKPVKNAKNSGEVGKTAIQVVERMMNLLDALAEQEESSSLKNLAE